MLRCNAHAAATRTNRHKSPRETEMALVAALVVAAVFSSTASGQTVTLNGASGNTVYSGGYDTSSGLVISQAFGIDYLVIGGGGSGGVARATDGSSQYIGAGGGGAGGFVEGSLLLTEARQYGIVVGSGGARATAGGANGNSGGASSFDLQGALAIQAAGGGGGGGRLASGVAGGSGGGGSGMVSGTSNGGTAVTGGQGFAGGAVASGVRNGGGGGGAGGAGTTTSGTVLGNGGAGKASAITGTSTFYAGGGGGARANVDANGSLVPGGSGGGGGGAAGIANTQAASLPNGEDAVANTGGGGGGSAGSSNIYVTTSRSGAGGSGIVVARYAGQPLTGLSASVSPTSFVGDGTNGLAGQVYQVYSFTSTSGTQSLDMSGVNLGERLGATISGVISGTGGLTYAGPGTLTLSASNSYSGATTISAGLLEIGSAGTINSTSGITVNGSTAEFKYNSATALTQPLTLTQGTISGTGTISADVVFAAGDSLSPGNSPGTQAYTGQLTWSPLGTYEWELNALTGTAGTNWDLVNVTSGTFNLSGLSAAPGNQFVLDLITLDAGNASGPLATPYNGGSHSFAIASYDPANFLLPTGFTNTAGADLTSLFTINLENWQGEQPQIGNASVKINSTATGIDLVIVPEPTALMLAATGALVAGWTAARRFRRR